MRLQFSPEFRRDLRSEKSYLTEHTSKDYADKVGIIILKECSSLKDFPHKGKSASERFEIDTDMLFLVIKDYIVFYRVTNETIDIVRLFNTRMNILFRMFGIDTSDPESESFWDE